MVSCKESTLIRLHPVFLQVDCYVLLQFCGRRDMAVLLSLLGSHVKHTVPDIFDVYLYELTNNHSGVGKELDYQPVTVPYLPVLVYITELKYLLNDPERAQREQRMNSSSPSPPSPWRQECVHRFVLPCS